ncbi:MAG: hypothetical protein KJ057_10400 [Phycisphaerae bacterium]|nr:MAG: folate-binding protein [Planctomycetota bacterium]KAB2949747.1 MAG: folate-binding protein YgfZ [Phycisphaerae bacterium]MBE7457493.1 folate-binding protein YgfZ [Planctomycetia bacterium]MCK6464532.1 hypothetical protein [Phycisphaerae bacterium]MCL4718869.1 hypothetical protein [Phycisphaerae bacterium]
MTQREVWLEGVAARGGALREVGGIRVPARFASATEDGAATADECAAVSRGRALCDRTHRGLIRVTGKDRAAWLHNLVTNQVKPLSPGEGNYAFALNVKGRILFDLVYLVRAEDILLDIERRLLTDALKHFNKYIIMEDVALTDLSAETCRIGVLGSGAGEAATAAGWATAENAALYQSGLLSDPAGECVAWRSDFCGVRGYEVSFPSREWNTVAARLAAAGDAAWIGWDAVEALRIEQGVPAYPNEINEAVLPAETGQLARAVSFNKGCYLGQEIVERMHARKAVSRGLVRLIFDDGDPPAPGSPVLDADGQVIGEVTSSCRSVRLSRPVALAYVKATAARDKTQLAVNNGAERRTGVVASSPSAV